MAAAPWLKAQKVIYMVSSDQAYTRMAEEAFRPLDARLEVMTSWNEVDPAMEDVVLLCDEHGPGPIECLMQHSGLHHVLMKNGLQTMQQLQVLARKLEGGRWGIQDYLEAGTAVHTLKVTDYGKKQFYIDQVRDHADSIVNGFNDLSSMAATIAWELIMNGLFNAPQVHGQPKYHEVSRRRDLVVEPGEAVELTFGHDERCFVISARDHFGALTRDVVVENLARASRADQGQIRRTTKGAGIGLYVVFTSASQLDFQIAPGERTDVTAVIQLSKRFKDFERSGHSINFFIEESKRP